MTDKPKFEDDKLRETLLTIYGDQNDVAVQREIAVLRERIQAARDAGEPEEELTLRMKAMIDETMEHGRLLTDEERMAKAAALNKLKGSD